MRSQFRRSRNVFVRLEVLEKRFVVQKEVNDQAAKIVELLRDYEELLESERSDPEYCAEREQEMNEEIIQSLIDQGLFDPNGGVAFSERRETGHERFRGEENAK